jgi:hypothetical protein
MTRDRPMSAGSFNELEAPLAYECPECGAKPGKRCRAIGTKAYTPRRPHPKRATRAWRDFLRKQDG